MNPREIWIKSMEMALAYAAALPEEEKRRLCDPANGHGAYLNEIEDIAAILQPRLQGSDLQFAQRTKGPRS